MPILRLVGLATHVEPDDTKLAVFEEQLVEVAVCQDEIEVSLPLLLTLQTDVGSLSIYMLRVAHTVE